jgi:hypothetical protein
MKKRNFFLCLLAALLVPALVVILQPARETSAAAKPSRPLTTAKAAPPVKSHDIDARATQTRSKTIQQFVETMGSWETAAGLDGDRIEEQLRGMITDENAEAILRALPPRFQGTYVANLLLSRWAARDRDGAIQWLAAQKNPTLFEVNAITKNWVEQDREGLERYLNDLPASAWKSLLLESTGRDALANNDPEQAFYLLRAMNDNSAKAPLLANAVQQWAQWDPRSAVEEIDKLPYSATRERLILAVASGFAMVNHDAAADWMRRSFPAGPALDRALAGVMQAWTSTGDPTKAVQWVTQLPDGATRNNAVDALVAAWNQENPETLKNWIGDLPEGPLRERATTALRMLVSTP